MSFTDAVKKLLYLFLECAAAADHDESDRERAREAHKLDEIYSYDEGGREVS